MSGDEARERLVRGSGVDAAWWAEQCRDLPWGWRVRESEWGRRDIPDPLLPWRDEVRAVRAPDALLRALLFGGASSAAADPVLFVPGWSSTPYSWRKTLPALAARHRTWYVETREKASSRLRPGDQMTVADMAADVAELARQTVASAGRYGVIAASTGAVLALHAHPLLDPPPAWIILLLPHVAAPVPSAARVLWPCPPSVLEILRWVLLPGARYVHRRRKANGLGGFYRVLRTADPGKLRQSLLTWQAYPGLDLDALAAIRCPCLVIGASRDRLHPAAAARLVADRLPSGIFVDGRTTAWGHGLEMVATAMSWIGAAGRGAGR
ncbi:MULTISPECIES: alpha/beta fold hydrolase [unclassified Pseudofrankia]|uniref:alpha/beta fold hydrolase n=1 Tax=unclassified Pseudofrankia TaxID=2994372 RepID=UPI0009F36705|nr:MULTISPECIES: alpha/beta hydrolase [unclassified Pseudofrankia]MDT3440315.1 alpha/beta hydrolase [Pseudofrankia sp. BMG5.37]